MVTMYFVPCKGESPLAENVAANFRNPFYFSLQWNFPVLDFYCLYPGEKTWKDLVSSCKILQDLKCIKIL